MIACDIRGMIDAVDEYKEEQRKRAEEMKKESKRTIQFNHVHLGAAQRPIKISTLAEMYSMDEAFLDFRKNLRTCIRDLVRRNRLDERLVVPEQGERTIDVHADEEVSLYSIHHGFRTQYLQITEYRFIQVKYESQVTWREERDLLRCSPKFRGAPRHDSVLMDWDGGYKFFKLVFTFMYKFRGVACALALVLPLDFPIGPRRPAVDRDLGLCRLVERPPSESKIVPLRALRRGALLIPDSKRVRNHLVVDALDGDMFLRCVDLFPDRDMAAQQA